MIVKVKKDNDPFKKYWWVLLLGFGGVAAWVCMPLMDQQVGSGSIDSGKDLRAAEQSLDSVANPNGAPGGALDLSMSGSGGYRKKDGGMTSSLYQAPAEAAAPGAPLVASSGGNASFADALRDVSTKKADASGWGGDKAQKGFNAPKANFGGMSGLGSGGGGGSGAGGGSAFGSGVAKTSMGTTKGLSGGNYGDPAKGGSPAMSALKNAQSSSLSAVNNKSNDASRSLSGGAFDGGRGGGAAIGGGGGALDAGYAGLDAAPANLKANSQELEKFEYEAPPAKMVDDSDQRSAEAKQKAVIMIAAMLVGGMVGGTAGTMIMMMTPMIIEQMQDGGKNRDGGSGAPKSAGI